MQKLFDLRQCSQCGQMHDLCYRGEAVSPTDSYWFTCPNGGGRVEFQAVKSNTLECPPESIECFCAEGDLNCRDPK